MNGNMLHTKNLIHMLGSLWIDENDVLFRFIAVEPTAKGIPFFFTRQDGASLAVPFTNIGKLNFEEYNGED
jgi:hypothetical protein